MTEYVVPRQAATWTGDLFEEVLVDDAPVDKPRAAKTERHLRNSFISPLDEFDFTLPLPSRPTAVTSEDPMQIHVDDADMPNEFAVTVHQARSEMNSQPPHRALKSERRSVKTPPKSSEPATGRVSGLLYVVLAVACCLIASIFAKDACDLSSASWPIVVTLLCDAILDAAVLYILHRNWCTD